MAYQLDEKMVIGVSSRALFDLTIENEIFEKQGVDAYCAYQVAHEDDILKPGPGFRLIQSILKLNEYFEDKNPVEVIIMSRNSPDTSLRVFNAIKHYNLPITRAVLVSGASLAPYLTAFRTDLFLSAYEDDVQCAIDSGIAAGIICTEHTEAVNVVPFQGSFTSNTCMNNACIKGKCSLDSHSCNALEQTADVSQMCQIRIAFDGDAVVFSDESERIYKAHGLHAFEENEARNADRPLEEGPFASFLRKLSDLQSELGREHCPIRTALVTARSAPAHERVIRTLRSWNVRVDEAFFLGGLEKKEFLRAFGAQIFFDDQSVHTNSASQAVPAARVPYKRDRKREKCTDEISAYRTG